MITVNRNETQSRVKKSHSSRRNIAKMTTANSILNHTGRVFAIFLDELAPPSIVNDNEIYSEQERNKTGIRKSMHMKMQNHGYWYDSRKVCDISWILWCLFQYSCRKLSCHRIWMIKRITEWCLCFFMGFKGRKRFLLYYLDFHTFTVVFSLSCGVSVDRPIYLFLISSIFGSDDQRCYRSLSFSDSFWHSSIFALKS